jgi:Cupin domain
MKRIVIVVAGFLLFVPLTLAGVAWATPPSGATSTTLGRISLGPYHETSPDFKIFSKNPTDTVVLTTTINPGGSTGWHSHPGPAFIVVTQGMLTVYDGNDPACTPHVYGPGTGFFDPGFGHMHIARRNLYHLDRLEATRRRMPSLEIVPALSEEPRPTGPVRPDWSPTSRAADFPS